MRREMYRKILIGFIALTLASCSLKKDSNLTEEAEFGPGLLTIAGGDGSAAAKIVQANQIATTFSSALGLPFLDQQTKSEVFAQAASLSQEGSPEELTGGVQNAMNRIGARLCSWLLNYEKAVSSPRYFGKIDFSATEIHSDYVNGVIILLARSLWGRNPAAEEIQLIESSTQEVLSETEDMATAMKYTCIAVISHPSAFTL